MSTGGAMLLVMLLAACTNSGLGQPTTTGSGDTGATTAAADCPWVGQWTLQAVNCSTFPFDEWYDTYSGGSMEITQADDGGCEVVTTVTAAECEEAEDWHFSAPTGVDVVLTYNGISACNPDACTFGGPDAPCAVGDRAGGTADIKIDDATGELAIIGILEDTAPNCTLGLRTTWAQ